MFKNGKLHHEVVIDLDDLLEDGEVIDKVKKYLLDGTISVNFSGSDISLWDGWDEKSHSVGLSDVAERAVKYLKDPRYDDATRKRVAESLGDTIIALETAKKIIQAGLLEIQI